MTCVLRISPSRTPVCSPVFTLSLLMLSPATLLAQQVPPATTLTVTGGYAAFLDDANLSHGVAGAGLEFVVRPRIAVGPELLYMIGPGDDRDLFVLGVARLGLRPFSGRLAPFVTVGGGLVRHSNRFNDVSFSRTEGAFMVVVCDSRCRHTCTWRRSSRWAGNCTGAHRHRSGLR